MKIKSHFFSTLLLLLLLLAVVTYNQVQSFQVNDYANHNVDTEITGCRELYSINCKQPCLHVYNVCVCVCVAYIPRVYVSNYTIIPLQ